METAVVLKASIAAATGGGLLDCLLQKYEHWRDHQQPAEDDEDDREEEEDDEGWIDLERAFKFGAKVLVVAPLAIGCGVHWLAHVPVKYVLQVTGITELIVVPCSVIIHQIDDCKGSALYKNFPKLVLLSCWGTFLTTYTLSVLIYHHRIVLLPIISSTGERFPENIVWTIGGSMTGLALVGLARGFLNGYVGQPKYIKDKVSRVVDLGYFGGVMMICVGIFSSGPYWTNIPHIIAAAVSGGCTLYTLEVHSELAVESGLVAAAYPCTAESSSSEQVSLRQKRLVYSHVTMLSAVIFMLTSGIPCAIFEYNAAVFWSLTVYSFNMDFQNQMVGQSPDSWGSGLGRRLSSREFRRLSSRTLRQSIKTSEG